MYELKTETEDRTFTLQQLPSECPFCHRDFTPTVLGLHQTNNFRIDVFMHCPNISCSASFIAYYELDNPNVYGPRCTLKKTMIGNVVGKAFDNIITSSYPSFVALYNEAFAAEQYELLGICGVGYRKALEFLLKEYCIETQPSKKDDIEKMLLGNVIDKYVNETRIKSVAKRAVWLGNDETHYKRKWIGKDLGDLKKLIDLTVHWIEMEKLTISFELEMPAS